MRVINRDYTGTPTVNPNRCCGFEGRVFPQRIWHALKPPTNGYTFLPKPATNGPSTLIHC